MSFTRFAVRFAVTVTVAWLIAGLARAQDVELSLEATDAPQLQMPAFTAIRRGQPSPSDGLLIQTEAMVQIRLDYDALVAQLDRDVTRAHDSCAALLSVERARTTAAGSLLTLHTGLWESRQGELVQRATRAEQAAVRQWYESEAMWLTIGAVVGGALVAALAASL
jgi:hypothetical protein